MLSVGRRVDGREEVGLVALPFPLPALGGGGFSVDQRVVPVAQVGLKFLPYTGGEVRTVSSSSFCRTKLHHSSMAR